MAEVIGMVSAVSTLIEQSFTLLERVQTAVERQKSNSSNLIDLSRDITSAKEIVGLVKDEAVLGTAGVAKAMGDVLRVVTNLEVFFKELEISALNSPVRQFAHQLIKGTKEQQKMDELMKGLRNAKSNLSLHIQVAHVGLTRTASQALAVDPNIVERIDKLLQKRLGEGKGLRIAALIRQRPRSSEGLVPLTDEDIKSLPKTPAKLGTKVGVSSRIVLNNTALDQAVQVNAPIGTEGWIEVEDLTIKDNVAKGYSTQINHAVSRDDFRAAIRGRFAGLKQQA